LARRYVVQWLLSFASSHELGSFPIWSEAVACLRAVLLEHFSGSLQGLGISEWVSSQVARPWPGASGRAHRLQALRELMRLVSDVLECCSASLGPDLLSLGEALKAVVEGWLQDAGGTDISEQDKRTVVASIWGSAHRFARAARASRAAPSDSPMDSGTARLESPSRWRTCAAQLNTTLHMLARFAVGDRGCGDKRQLCDVQARTLAQILIGSKDIASSFVQSVDLLATCPESTVLQTMVACVVQLWLQPPDVSSSGNGEEEEDDGHLVIGKPDRSGMAALQNLSTEAEESVVSALGQVLASLQGRGEGAPSIQETLLPMVHALASLPYRQPVVWRIHALACTIILEVFPEALLQEKIQRSVACLPSPDTSVSGLGVTEAMSRKWGATAAEVLGCLLVSCDELGRATARQVQIGGRAR